MVNKKSDYNYEKKMMIHYKYGLFFCYFYYVFFSIEINNIISLFIESSNRNYGSIIHIILMCVNTYTLLKVR